MSLFSDLGSILHKGIDALKTVARVTFTYGDDVVNAIKAIESTPVGADLINVIDNAIGLVIPASYLAEYKTLLASFAKGIGWVKSELDKSDDEIISDLVTWFNGIVDPFTKASVAHVLNAHGSLFMSDKTSAAVTIPVSLTMPQIVHNPALFDTVTPVPAQPVVSPVSDTPLSSQPAGVSTFTPSPALAGQQTTVTNSPAPEG